MPKEVSGNDTSAEKLRPYKNPEQCLSDFSEWFDEKGKNPDALLKYQFTIQMAPFAISEYDSGKATQRGMGTTSGTKPKRAAGRAGETRTTRSFGYRPVSYSRYSEQ